MDDRLTPTFSSPNMQSDLPHDSDGQGTAGVEPNNGEPPSGDAKHESAARPTWLTVIAVLCLLEGFFGMLSGVIALTMLFLGDPFEQVMQLDGSETSELGSMHADFMAHAQRYMWINMLLVHLRTVLAIVLAASGVGIFMAKPWARTLLVRVLPIAIVVEILGIVVQTLIQISMASLMREHLDTLASETGTSHGEWMGNMMQIMQYVGLVFFAGWTLLEIGVMVWSRHYLNTPAARAYFRTT